MTTWSRGLSAQLRVLEALILRETRTRFGANHLGYLWAFIEPLTMILTFYAMFVIAERTAPSGLALAPFLTTGIVPFMAFRSTANRSTSAIDANKALLFYPQVRPLDLILARSVLEVATLASVFAVLLGAHALIEQSIEFDDLLVTLLGLTLAGLLGVSLGLILCAASVFSKAVDRIQSPLFRPLFWVSGLFFTANDLPARVRDIMLLNPVFHVVEIVRDGWFRGYTARHASVGYVLAWILFLTLLGLTLERVARRRLELT